MVSCKCGVITAPKMLCYIVITGGTKTQKQQQERNCCSQHFSFFFPRLKITTGKLHRGLMLHLPPCCLYMQAAREAVCAEINSSCLMSSVLNTLLKGVARLPGPVLPSPRGDNLVLSGGFSPLSGLVPKLHTVSGKILNYIF